jgi:hypothetical protein
MIFAHVAFVRQVYSVAIFAEIVLVTHTAPGVVTVGFTGMHDFFPFLGAVIYRLQIKSSGMTSTAFALDFCGFIQTVAAKTRDHFIIVRIR